MSVEQRVETRLQILERRVRRRGGARRTASPQRDVRTCVHCGARAPFLYDPRGGWSTCTSCGRYA